VIRADLEDSKYALDRLRYALASALFAGSPAGARTVLPLEISTGHHGALAAGPNGRAVTGAPSGGGRCHGASARS
jgi:hypothetical protein